MFNKKRKAEKTHTYPLCKPVCTVLYPFCKVLFYAAVILIALLLVLMFIVFLMNTSVDEMLLPPFMHKIADDAGVTTAYEIFLGNGVKVLRPAAMITAGDIKTVIYAGIILLVGVLLIIAPASKFVGALAKNIKDGKYLDEKNGRLVMYTGLTVLVGNPFILFVSRFYNYYLIKTFLKEASDEISLALGFDVYGMIFGALILLFGLIYAKTLYALHTNEVKAEDSTEKAVVPENP